MTKISEVFGNIQERVREIFPQGTTVIATKGRGEGRYEVTGHPEADTLENVADAYSVLVHRGQKPFRLDTRKVSAIVVETPVNVEAEVEGDEDDETEA